MNLNFTYILSQIFTIIMYAFLALTYYAKDRKKVLILNILSLIAIMIAYILLNAWTGTAMTIVALIRNVIFLVDEEKGRTSDKITKKDIIILAILYVVLIGFAIVTYDGFLSLFSVFATAICNFSVWQKDVKIYKLLGIPVEVCWIVYNTHIMSIMGIILEVIMLICAITGYLLEIKKGKDIAKN